MFGADKLRNPCNTDWLRHPPHPLLHPVSFISLYVSVNCIVSAYVAFLFIMSCFITNIFSSAHVYVLFHSPCGWAWPVEICISFLSHKLVMSRRFVDVPVEAHSKDALDYQIARFEQGEDTAQLQYHMNDVEDRSPHTNDTSSNRTDKTKETKWENMSLSLSSYFSSNCLQNFS